MSTHPIHLLIDPPLRCLGEPREIVKVLGGTSKLAELLGLSPASVSNAMRRGRFPPDWFAAMSAELSRLGYNAPPHLWQQIEPAPEPAIRCSSP